MMESRWYNFNLKKIKPNVGSTTRIKLYLLITSKELYGNGTGNKNNEFNYYARHGNMVDETLREV